MSHPNDPMRSPYAPSFLAGYRSACAMLSTVREQFARFPVQIARFWVLWTHVFSSTVRSVPIDDVPYLTHARPIRSC